TVSSFWKEHASATLPGNCSSTYSSTRSAGQLSTSVGSCRLTAKEHLLQGVAAQPEPERLERDDLLGRDVPEVHTGAEVLHEPRLRLLGRRLPDEVVEVDRMLDLRDQARAHLTVLPEDARGATLACLGDHLPRARVLFFLDPLDPFVRREDDLGVLRADLGEDGEVACEVGDQLELALARDVDRAIGDLDVCQAEAREPRLVLVELILDVDGLEEGAADHDRLALENVELALEALG